MTKQIEVHKSLSRAEKIKVSLGAAALGAIAVGAVGASVAHEISKPDTHQKTVRVEFDEDTPTIYDGAMELRQRQGATESVTQLENELRAAEPGHDGVVHPGDVAQIEIDVADSN
jgi:hypothetical protein